MLIKDIRSGTVRKYGTDCHDSLSISQDGRTLSYYNLQCGDGSQYGDFRFVMEDGEVPKDSNTPDAMYCECYFNIGGFDRNLADHDKQIRDEILDNVQIEVSKEIEKQIRDEVIDYIVGEIIFPLLDECDIGLWKNIDYIELAEKWVEAVQNNLYPKVKNHNENIKKYLKEWIAEQMKGEQNE